MHIALRWTTGLLLLLGEAAGTTRIKELATLQGVRDNQLVGYGLVVGLAGTGDKSQTIFSAQSLASLLERLGVAVPPGGFQVRNTAAVLITATLPPFAQPGTRIDITASAIGDSNNLQGGQLVMTPLKGPDGQVYAVAQGAVVTGGFGAGRGGNTQVVNHPTVGRVAGGALVERLAPSQVPAGPLRFQLRQADFTTAARLAKAVNLYFKKADGEALAQAENAGVIRVTVPAEYASRRVELIAEIENLTVEADRLAKIVVNEKTGTVTIGKQVRIAPVAILHGNLSVEIQTTPQVSQPNELSNGKTVVTEQTSVTAKEERARSIILPKEASVEELVRALSAIGSTPRDIIAILQSLRAAGALEAELEII